VPIVKGFTQRFSQQDLEIVREQKLDVILRFGFNILRGEILSVPRYGIWSYHHGDNAYYRGGPAYFWEIYERHPLSGVILQVLSEELDAGLVLCKANLETQQGVSTVRNRVQPYWTASFFVIRKLHQLHQYGWEQVAEQSSRAQLVAGAQETLSIADQHPDAALPD
jgi:methionyl-tRNA formyltransferase